MRSSASGLLLLVAISPAAHALDGVVDRVAAVVNSDLVTLSQVYELGSVYIDESCPGDGDTPCRRAAEQSVLEALIQQSLMRQDLVRLGYDVRPEDVDQAIQQVLDQYGFPDRAALRVEVEKTGTTWEDYRSKLADDIRLQRFQGIILRNRISISDDELQDRYRRRLRELDTPLVARISAFGFLLPSDMTPSERVEFVTKFMAVFAEVRAGARTWESVVEEFDTARLARAFAGQAFREADLARPIAAVAFSTPVGEVADPVFAGNVLYGVKVLAREEAPLDPPSFESLRDELTQQIFEEKLADAEAAWYESARRTAAVRVLIPGPEDEDDDEDDDEAEGDDP